MPELIVPRPCKVEGCGSAAWARGLCGKHRAQWKAGKPGIEPDPPRRVMAYAGLSCSVPECSDPAEDQGMCGKHAQRVRRYGDHEYVTPEEVRRRNNRQAQLMRFQEVKPTTYRKFFGRHTHRVVAEEKIGRPLAPGEIVHHRDEDRHNNSPRNLEVLKGQSEHTRKHRRGPGGKFS